MDLQEVMKLKIKGINNPKENLIDKIFKTLQKSTVVEVRAEEEE